MPLYKGIEPCYMLLKHVTYMLHTYNIWVRSMLYVCYMFSKHITCFKASVYRGLRPVMLYGYMFLRSPGLQGSKVRASWGLGMIPKPLGDSSFTP